MSVWSQVAMIFRIDYIKWDGYDELNFEEIFGKTYTWNNCEDYKTNLESYLPMGSEGSLDMSVWVNPCENHLDRYTVSIFGSLRDHEREDVKKLFEWFNNKCKQLKPRQAVITIDNDLVGTITKTYQDEKH